MALALAGTPAPTTLAGHPVWEIENPKKRAAQRIQFLKNLAMPGRPPDHRQHPLTSPAAEIRPPFSAVRTSNSGLPK